MLPERSLNPSPRFCSYSPPASVLDLNAVQGCQRHDWRPTQHRCLCSHLLRVAGFIVLIINVILVVILLVWVITLIHATEEQTSDHTIIRTSKLSNILGSLDSPHDDTYRRDLAAIYRQNGNSKPAAHCVIQQGFNTTVGKPVVLHWKCEGDSLHLGQNISYREGSLTVTIGGYYFLYSEILYSGVGKEELDYGRIIHKVVKEKVSELDESPTVLMQNLQSTPTLRRGRQVYTTSSLGGTFYLDRKSRIKVLSSNPRNVNTNDSPFASRLGLFLM